MRAVYGKELSSYFRNPMGFIYLAIYYLFGGQFLLMQMYYVGTNDISGVFANFYLVVLFSLPLLTMRSFAEEKRQKTDQALFTAPVSLGEIVLGKFFAAFTLFALGIGVCVIYFIVLSAFSGPYWSMFLGNMFGLLLLGGALISMGIFVSAMTESQVIAAVGTFGCVLAVLLLDGIGQLLPAGLSLLEEPLEAISFSKRYYDFTSGILDFSHVMFFLSVMAVFLFMTVGVLDKNRQVASKRLRNLSVAWAQTALFMVVVILINMVFSLALRRLPSMDLTGNQIYRLSKDSISILENVSEPVVITVCYDEEALRSTEYGLQADELLKEYPRRNSYILVRFADILREPEIAAEYTDYGVTQGSIIIESERRIKVAAVSDCVERTTSSIGSGYTYSSRAEQVFTSGILYVTENEPLQVSILTGHSEVGCDDIVHYLQDNNYMMREQNIATEDVDGESEMVFLFAPTTDYTADELKKLDAFLDNDGAFGKTLVYVASHVQPRLPNLESFLSEWGIGVENSIIIETDFANAYDQQGFMFAADFTEAASEYLEKVRNRSLPFLGYYCRTLSVLFDEKDNRTAKALIVTPNSCILYPLEQEDGAQSDEDPSSYAIAVLGDRLKYIGAQERHSRVAAFASAAMFSSSAEVGNSFNNQDFTVEFLNTLAGKQNGINIPSVSLSAERLNFTQSQYLTVSVVLGILLPLGVFVTGIIVWLYRRRL